MWKVLNFLGALGITLIVATVTFGHSGGIDALELVGVFVVALIALTLARTAARRARKQGIHPGS